MNILKQVLLNKLIKIPAVRNIARKVNNKTGINGNEVYVNKTYEMYTKFAPVKDNAVLELGPGHTYQVVQKALESGAKSVDIADIELVIDRKILEEKNIAFTLYDGQLLPYKDNAFDLIWSHTVYEHLRYPEVTVAETWRVLKPGGTAVHWIDLRDHFVLKTEDTGVFNMLRYSQKLWEKMTWNRSTYVNRFRFSQWLDLHKKYGFTIVHTEKEISNAVKSAQNSITYLRDYTQEDAITAQMLLVIKK
jgi:SAM-dependent methyltransferase